MSDPLLEEMRDAVAMDNQYTAVITALRENRSKAWVQGSNNNLCRDYIAIWD